MRGTEYYFFQRGKMVDSGSLRNEDSISFISGFLFSTLPNLFSFSCLLICTCLSLGLFWASPPAPSGSRQTAEPGLLPLTELLQLVWRSEVLVSLSLPSLSLSLSKNSCLCLFTSSESSFLNAPFSCCCSSSCLCGIPSIAVYLSSLSFRAASVMINSSMTSEWTAPLLWA